MAIRELNIEQVEAVSGGATTLGAVLNGVAFVGLAAGTALAVVGLVTVGGAIAVVGGGAAALAYVYDAAVDAAKDKDTACKKT